MKHHRPVSMNLKLNWMKTTDFNVEREGSKKVARPFSHLYFSWNISVEICQEKDLSHSSFICKTVEEAN